MPAARRTARLPAPVPRAPILKTACKRAGGVAPRRAQSATSIATQASKTYSSGTIGRYVDIRCPRTRSADLTAALDLATLLGWSVAKLGAFAERPLPARLQGGFEDRARAAPAGTGPVRRAAGHGMPAAAGVFGPGE